MNKRGLNAKHGLALLILLWLNYRMGKRKLKCYWRAEILTPSGVLRDWPVTSGGQVEVVR